MKVKFPIFLPDATRGVVRSLDSQDLKSVGIEGLVVNTFHLLIQPGAKSLARLGGVKKLMNWENLTVSDSGGFQLFSLVLKNPEMGKITEDGVQFKYEVCGNMETYMITPEKSIQVQFAIGSDIKICLDYFSPPDGSRNATAESVEKTISWAKRCRIEFEKQLKIYAYTGKHKPKLFCVVQGGKYPDLRERCAQELLKIGFDGFGLGGWPSREEVELMAKILPAGSELFALGVGDLKSIAHAHSVGFNYFDCVLPTRDARHKRLYVLTKDLTKVHDLANDTYHEYVYFSKAILSHDTNPIDKTCDCLVCAQYSRAYLYHLFKIGDSLAWRLASLHNLRTYTRLIDELRRR